VTGPGPASGERAGLARVRGRREREAGRGGETSERQRARGHALAPGRRLAAAQGVAAAPSNAPALPPGNVPARSEDTRSDWLIAPWSGAGRDPAASAWAVLAPRNCGPLPPAACTVAAVIGALVVVSRVPPPGAPDSA